MKNKFIFCLALLLLLTGCAQRKMYIQGVPVVSENEGVQQAELQLADAATSIKQSLLQLTEIKRAAHPTLRLPGPPNARLIGMDKLASVDWAGPIEPLIKDIAAVTGYNFQVLGKQPAIPVLVSVHENNTPIATILRNAGFQCGNKVDIVLYPRSKILELRYAQV